ncbi:MAG: sugar phosphate isomerase/epimerase, partial [Roseburia sp.]|nr:sugar phosphate isomerase/epimerase [Roseburia sp.]
MKLVTSTGDFDRFCDSYLERIQYVYEAGFRYMDLSLYTVREKEELIDNDHWMENVSKIKEYAKEHEIQFLQAHGPDTNALAGEEAFTIAVRRTIRAIEVCGELNIPNMVVHGGWDKDATKEEWFERNRQFYRALIPAMERNHVNVLHENTTNANMPWYYPKTGADMKSFVKYVNHPLFHACWDTGDANIEGSQYQEILDIGEELYAVHINDNRGMGDEHIIPFMGTMNMDEIMHALKDVGFTGPFTLEAGSVLRPKNYWLGNRRDFEKEKRLENPPLYLQRELEKFMYQTGKYILEAYQEF